MRVIGKAALLATAVGALVGVGTETAHAGGSGSTATGRDGHVATAQDGDQNFDCGNTHELVTVNALRTTTRHERCTDRGESHSDDGTFVVGGTSLGPQFTTAQNGRQNLHCGNSANTLTVNVLGTIDKETTCEAEYGPGSDSGGEPGRISAVGGTSLGPQFTTAQSGRQNLDCGNSADMLTLNVLGTINEKTACVAVDRRPNGPTHHTHHAQHDGHGRGMATAESGTSLGAQSATAQNGRQNLHCGSGNDLLSVPSLGRTAKTVDCAAVDRSTARR